VLSGAVGDVDVNITALTTLLREVKTDEFGLHAESETLFDILLNGTPIFSVQVDAMNPIGPNGFARVEGQGTNILDRFSNGERKEDRQ